MEKELNYLKSAIDEPARPFAAIIGGSRLSSKVIALESLVEKADILYISGALRFTFYAALGWPTGNSTFEPELVSKAAHIMERARALGCHLVLPEDSILADNFDADAESQVCDADKTPGKTSLSCCGVCLFIFISVLQLAGWDWTLVPNP